MNLPERKQLVRLSIATAILLVAGARSAQAGVVIGHSALSFERMSASETDQQTPRPPRDLRRQAVDMPAGSPASTSGTSVGSGGFSAVGAAVLANSTVTFDNLVAWLHGEYVLSRPDPPPVNLMRPPETVVTLRV